MHLLFPTGIIVILFPGDHHTEASLSTMPRKDQVILFYASLVTPIYVMVHFRYVMVHFRTLIEFCYVFAISGETNNFLTSPTRLKV